MRTPSELLYHIPCDDVDTLVYLDKKANLLRIGEQTLPLSMTYELIEILQHGMEILEPKGAPQVDEPYDPITHWNQGGAPSTEKVLSTAALIGGQKWEDKMADMGLRPAPTQSYAGSPLLDSQKDYAGPGLKPDPAPVVASGPSDDYDDPTKVWRIRHEHKDLWFTTDDMTTDRRECTGRRPLDAHCFPTKYSAHRFMQNFKQGHPVTLLEYEAAHIVYYQESPQAKRFYVSKNGATANIFEAHKMTLSQAQLSLGVISDSITKGIEKVAL